MSLQIRCLQFIGHCWRSKNETVSQLRLWDPKHGRRWMGRPATTFTERRLTPVFRGRILHLSWPAEPPQRTWKIGPGLYFNSRIGANGVIYILAEWSHSFFLQFLCVLVKAAETEAGSSNCCDVEVAFVTRIYFAKSSALLRKLKWPLEKNYLSWNSVSEIFKFHSKLSDIDIRFVRV